MVSQETIHIDNFSILFFHIIIHIAHMKLRLYPIYPIFTVYFSQNPVFLALPEF